MPDLTLGAALAGLPGLRHRFGAQEAGGRAKGGQPERRILQDPAGPQVSCRTLQGPASPQD
eukprot:7406513-Pyramimonas_sp.AAC.1